MNYVLLIVFLCLVSCGGPTKTGQMARQKAHARMDLVNADLASQQARQQFEVGQLDAAITTIDVAIDRYPEKSEYHQLRGRILLEQHKLDDARSAFETASTLLPAAAEPHYLLGVLHQRWGDDETALRSYTSACQNDPSHAQFFLAKAETLTALNRDDEAIELLVGKHQFQHQASIPALLGQIYLRTGKATLAAQHFADSRSLGNDDPILFADLAIAEFRAGLYAQCLMTLRELELITEDGLTTLQRRVRGKCLAATGQLVQGRDICLSVTRETPQDADAWIDLGFIAWKMGDYRRLGTCGNEISKLAPSVLEGPLFIGKAAQHAGNSVLAEDSLALAVSLSENDELAGWILANARQTNRKNATVLQEAPNTPTKTAEKAIEEPILGLVEGSEPLVIVPQN
ncbi:MAG: tetratricopeptide repeat protein [Planctomycetes bacterium]|nr:tetratricopeptide repeat protein [Planctomycetota bacterium]